MSRQQDTLFRSADMCLTQLYIANEIGREVTSALGELGIMAFRDVRPRSERRLDMAQNSADGFNSSTPKPQHFSVRSRKRLEDWIILKDSSVRILPVPTTQA